SPDLLPRAAARLHAVRGPDLLGPHYDCPLDGRDGNRQGLGANVHRERIRDGDGQRQTDPKAGSAPSFGLDLDLTAEAADVLAHDVHSDTAACVGRHRGRRAESGKEDQIEDAPLAEPRERLGRDETAAPCRFADGLYVDAPAVVRYLDVDRPALVSGAEV